MQNEMRERMMAQQIAKSRELFQWLSAFYLISSIGMIRVSKLLLSIREHISLNV